MNENDFYTHIAFADNAQGNGFTFDAAEGENKAFKGIYSDFTPEDSQDPQDYNWLEQAPVVHETSEERVADGQDSGERTNTPLGGEDSVDKDFAMTEEQAKREQRAAEVAANAPLEDIDEVDNQKLIDKGIVIFVSKDNGIGHKFIGDANLNDLSYYRRYLDVLEEDEWKNRLQ